MSSNMAFNDSLDVRECSGTHSAPPTNIWNNLKKFDFFSFFQIFCLHFKPFLLEKWSKAESKKVKKSIFWKWSLISKIRHGYDLRLCLNFLWRLWGLWKREIGFAIFLWMRPLKQHFSRAFIAPKRPKLICRSKKWFLKSCFKWLDELKYSF